MGIKSGKNMIMRMPLKRLSYILGILCTNYSKRALQLSKNNSLKHLDILLSNIVRKAYCTSHITKDTFHKTKIDFDHGA